MRSAVLCTVLGFVAAATDSSPAPPGVPTRRDIFARHFKACVAEEDCAHRAHVRGQPAHLRVLQWFCPDECAYRAMWATEDEYPRAMAAAGRAPGPKQQYGGRWAFRRVLGLQEPFSSLFSLGNLAAHVYGYTRVYCAADGGKYAPFPETTPALMDGPVRLIFFVSVNAWFWSTAYHARDVRLTRDMDYHWATAVFVVNTYAAIVRVFGLRRGTSRRAVLSLLGSVLALHVLYMTFVRFNYDWARTLGAIFVVFGTALYLGWAGPAALDAWRLGPKAPMPHAWLALAATGALLAAASFEVFDFPPVLGATLDAHAVWHALTIPIVVLWYRFFALNRH